MHLDNSNLQPFCWTMCPSDKCTRIRLDQMRSLSSGSSIETEDHQLEDKSMHVHGFTLTQSMTSSKHCASVDIFKHWNCVRTIRTRRFRRMPSITTTCEPFDFMAISPSTRSN